MTDEGTESLRVHVVGAEIRPTLPSGAVATTTRADADLVVAIGESALTQLGRDGCTPPIVPVDAGTGVRSVPREQLTDAVSCVIDGEHSTWSAPRITVTVDGETLGTALFDVMLVTEEPAHISEFSVRSATESIAQFRADGVLVATAPGTSGYARRVGAPVAAPETPAAAVVPVAPFATSLDHWTVPLVGDDPLVEMTVERDEAAVTLLADDRIVGPVPRHVPLTVRPVGSLTLVRVPESQSVFVSRSRSPRDAEQP